MRIFILLVVLTTLSVIEAKKHQHICNGAKLGTCSAIQTIVCYQCIQAGLPISVGNQETMKHDVQECKCNAVQEAYLNSQIEIFNVTLQREENMGKMKNPHLISVVIRMIRELISIKFSTEQVNKIIEECVKIITNNPSLVKMIRLILELYNKAVAKKIPSKLFELLVYTISTETEKGISLTVELIEKLLTGEQNSNSFLPVLKLARQIIRLKVLYPIKLIAMICTINGYDEYTKNTMLIFTHQIDMTLTAKGIIKGMPVLGIGITVLEEVSKTTFNNSITLGSVSMIISLGGRTKLLRGLINAVPTIEDLIRSIQFINKHISAPNLDQIFIVLKNLLVIKDNEQVRHIFDLIYWRSDFDKNGNRLKQLLVRLTSVLKCGEKSTNPSGIVSAVIELLMKGGKTDKINNILLIVTKATKGCNLSFDKLIEELKPQIVKAFNKKLNQIVVKLLIMVFDHGDMSLMPDLSPPHEGKPPPPEDNHSMSDTDVTQPPPLPPPAKTLVPVIVNPVTIPPDVEPTPMSFTVCPCEQIPLPQDVQEMMGELNGLEVAECVQNQCSDCFRGVCSICMNPACKKCALKNCKDGKGQIIIKESDPSPCWMEKSPSRKSHGGHLRQDMGSTCKKKYLKWLKNRLKKKS